MLPSPYSDEASKPLGPTEGQQATPFESSCPQKMNQNHFPTDQWPPMFQPTQMGYSGSGPIFFAPNPSKVLYDNYKAGQSKFLGISQIIFGVLCIAICATVLIVKEYKRYLDNCINFTIHGIWGGVFFIITGSFGIAAGVHKTRGVIITFMVLGILSTIVGAYNILFNSADIYDMYNNRLREVLYDASDKFEQNSSLLSRYSLSGNSLKVWNKIILSSHILLIIFSLLQGIFSLWGSILCCRVACCGANSHAQYTMLPQPTMMMMNPMNDNYYPQALGYSNFGYSNASSNSMLSNNLAEDTMKQSMKKNLEDDDEEF